jgi:hypothetical protein
MFLLRGSSWYSWVPFAIAIARCAVDEFRELTGSER